MRVSRGCRDAAACIERIRNVLATESAAETGLDDKYGWQSSEDLVPNVNATSTRHQQKSHLNIIELTHSFVIVGPR
jgi:hypothetical protein